MSWSSKNTYLLEAEDQKQLVQVYVMSKSWRVIKNEHTEPTLQCLCYLRLSYIHTTAD